jgi:mRNA interferase HigB
MSGVVSRDFRATLDEFRAADIMSACEGKVRIIAIPRLRVFAKKHAAQAGALRSWETIVKAADWKKFADLRKTYRKADRVALPKGNEITVFNVGDGFRLLTHVKYLPAPSESIVYIREYLTHAEYETNAWKTRLDHD